MAAQESGFPKKSARTRVFKEWPVLGAQGGEERHHAAACKNPRSHPGKTWGMSDRTQAGEEMIHTIKDAAGLMEQVTRTWPR